MAKLPSNPSISSRGRGMPDLPLGSTKEFSYCIEGFGGEPEETYTHSHEDSSDDEAANHELVPVFHLTFPP